MVGFLELFWVRRRPFGLLVQEDGEPWFGNEDGGEVLRRTTWGARFGCVASPSRRR